MKKLMMALPLAVLLFTACKKDDASISTGTENAARIKTFTIKQGAVVLNVVTHEYDKQGRRQKTTYQNGDYINFTYVADTMRQEHFNKDGSASNKYTYYLNAAGQADLYFNNAAPKIITYQTFNAQKKLVSEITKNLFVTTSENYHFYNAEGNKIKDSIPGTNGATIRSYEYYTAIKSTMENENYGFLVSGMSNVNAVKKLIIKAPGNTLEFNYTIPQTDSKGRISSQSYTSNGVISENIYSYY